LVVWSGRRELTRIILAAIAVFAVIAYDHGWERDHWRLAWHLRYTVAGWCRLAKRRRWCDGRGILFDRFFCRHHDDINRTFATLVAYDIATLATIAGDNGLAWSPSLRQLPAEPLPSLRP
jgi:hypothetical protein